MLLSLSHPGVVVCRLGFFRGWLEGESSEDESEMLVVMSLYLEVILGK